jgi:hypothetical protein
MSNQRRRQADDSNTTKTDDKPDDPRKDNDSREVKELTPEQIENIVEVAGVPSDDHDDDNPSDIYPPILPTDEIEQEEDDDDDHPPQPNQSQPIPSILDQINKEKGIQKRKDMIVFLQELAKAPSRNLTDVATKLNMSPRTAQRYVKEYVEVVKESLHNKLYPESVLIHYNSNLPKQFSLLRVFELDQLKEIIKRYAQYDIDVILNRTLNNDDQTNSGVQKAVALNDYPTKNNPLLNNSGPGPGPQPQSPPFNDEVIQEIDDGFREISRIEDGITALQLIRFGLVTLFGQRTKIQIALMIGDDVTPFLMDENRFKNLLVMAKIEAPRAQYFIDWLKTKAKHVAHPTGFLSYSSISGNHYYGTQDQSVGSMNGSGSQSGGAPSGQSWGAEEIDQTDRFLYDMKVYIKGYAPSHPMNVEALRKYNEDKKEEEQLKMMNRKMEMMMKMQLMNSMTQMGGGGQQQNNGGMGMFTPEMLLLTGMGHYEKTGVTEDGKVTWGIVPNAAAGGMQGPNGQGGAGGPVDQVTSTMGMLKEVIGFMATMNKPNEQSSSMMNGIFQALVDKAINGTDKVDELGRTLHLINEIKGPQLPNMMGMPGAPGAPPPPLDPTVAIETTRMQTDKEFGLRLLDLKKDELELKRERLRQGDQEASQNLQALMGGLSGVIPEVISTVKGLFLNKQGGAGPGMMAQPGMGGGAAIGEGGENNPVNTLIKMEYEKERRRQQSIAESRKMKWQEEMSRKNAEYELEMNRLRNNSSNMQQPGAGFNQPSHRVIQRAPETEMVQINEPPPPPPPASPQQQPQPVQSNVTPQSFSSYEVPALENGISEINERIRELEKYKASMAAARHDKIVNTNVSVPIQQPQPEEPTNYAELIDNVQTDQYDPDFTGIPDEGTTTAEVTENKVIGDDEKEVVDI